MPFPFSLLPPDRSPDPFQIEAVDHLMAGRSVVVSVPTGSGKTLIAEAAAVLALERGERLFYTTPLKALSNQKFRDLGKLFGSERCGLLTGDTSVRPDAAIVVMTTEVFRNMLLRPGSDDRLSGVRFVVLDECHYIGRWGRGTVWEEAILGCPLAAQLLALSATVANADQVAGWINTIHPTTALVESVHRSVPLRYYTFRDGSLRALPPAGGTEKNLKTPPMTRAPGTARAWEEPERPEEVVGALAAGGMLPAIYFLFSRRGCEVALEACSGLCLLEEDERRRVEALLEAWQEEYPSLPSYPFLPELKNGMAVHHAGMLPSWKLAVERLFQQNLLKVVFATETLAAGINMPARSTIISSLRRPGEHGYRALAATEFHQMAGRAGRRGMDVSGNVIILTEPQGARSAASHYVLSRPEALGSCLAPGYSLVLNWLRTYGSDRAEEIIRSGLASYLRPKPGRASSFIDVSPAWQRFQAARAVLEHYGLLDGDRPAGVGLLTASLQSENELLAARIFAGALPATPEPALLAGLAGAIAGAASSRPRGAQADPASRTLPMPRPLQAALRTALALAADLREVQRRCGFSCPTVLSMPFAVLAVHWAAGRSWGEILDATSLDEGDIAYTMRSAIDLLEQIAGAPIAPAIRAAAAQARILIDRPPVSEVL